MPDEQHEADLIDAIGCALFECDEPVWQWADGRGAITVENVTWNAAPEDSKRRYIDRALAALSAIGDPPQQLVEDVGRATGLSVAQVRAVLSALVDTSRAASARRSRSNITDRGDAAS